MALFDTIRAGASGASADYEIDRSLRFNKNDSAYLERTPSSDSNRTTMTLSVWVKRGKLGEMMIMESYRDDANRTRLMFDALNRMQMFQRFQNNSHPLIAEAHRKDNTAWYHLVWSIDTTQSTSSNRVKMYVNGEQQSFISGSNSQPDQNEALFFNKDERHTIGVGQDSGGLEVFFDGYMAEMNFIDGQQLPPSSFAETDAVTGEYKPIEYDGSYGTNGFYLNFSDNSSTSALGTDSSGGGNNYSTNGFSVSSGKNGDSFADTPTNNFCTLNEQNRGDDLQELTDGMLTRGGGSDKCLATFLLENGKYYFEYLAEDSNGNHLVGVTLHDTDMRSRNNSEQAFYAANGEFKIMGGSQQSGFSSYSNGDIIGVAVDTTLSTPKIYFAKNNSWQGDSGSSGTFNASGGYSLTAGRKYVFNADHGSSGGSTTGTCFFGAHQGEFNYTPPTGFVAACSQNLPEPTIKKGKLHQETLLYSADNGSHTAKTISGLSFSPDWVWCKNRSRNNRHALFDVVRGVTKRLRTDGTDGQVADADTLTSFNSDGFSIGADVGEFGVNANDGSNFAAWCWEAGSSTVTNSNGSISAQVRANATAGFSVVTYTGTGSNATVGHGLGVALKSYFIKRIDTSGHNWRVYHDQLDHGEDPEEFNLRLNSTGEQDGQSNIFNDTKPTSSVFSIGTHSSVNNHGADYVAYCFAEVSGYSAFGKYTGNGGAGSGTDGPYIYLGFRPAWIMVKRMNGSENWCIWDNKRNGTDRNPNGRILRPDSNTSEGGNITGSSGHAVDFTHNGFLCRTGEQKINANGSAYVYWAFAENPAKISRAG